MINGQVLAFNGPKRGFDSNLSPQFLCHHCDKRMWRTGGASSLGQHLIEHGIATDMPSYQRIDGEGYQLDLDNKRVRVGAGKRRTDALADTTVDGWLRSRRHVGVIWEGRDA